MRRVEEVLGEDEGFFGPGTDLAISLAAVLLLMIAIKSSLDERERRARFELEARLRAQTALAEQERKSRLEIGSKLHQGQLEIKEVLDNQAHLVEALAGRYGAPYRTVAPNTYAITLSSTTGEDTPDIVIHNDATLQRISFGSHVLFDGDQIKLLMRGNSMLKELSGVLLADGRLEHIQEIQIQGHADPEPSHAYSSNLELAAHRAMTVFLTLQAFGIDPRYSMMSATTFGEYVPVQRRFWDGPYSPEQLAADNDSFTERMMNRRIEILLFYRRLS
jgi:outer membrane protein OmpA-like peptidoglycan-associated protein